MAKFQKRHYIALALSLHNAKDSDPKSRWRDIVESISDMLGNDNDNFDRERFTHACSTGNALGRHIQGGPAVGQYGYEGGHKYDKILGR